MWGLLEKYDVSANTMTVALREYENAEGWAEEIRHGGERGLGLQGWQAPQFNHHNLGVKSAAELAVIALMEGLVTWEECRFCSGPSKPVLRTRKLINSILKKHGWTGTLLDEESKRRPRTRSEKLAQEVENLQRKLGQMEEKRAFLNDQIIETKNSIKRLTNKISKLGQTQ